MNPQLFQLICFYAFGFVTVAAALAVITLRNTVHAVLALVLTFFSTACLWMLADAEFLALALIVVYVGAVMVLFLFVVMMLDINLDVLRKDFKRFVPMATLVGAIIIVETALILWHGYGATSTPVRDAAAAGASAMPNTYLIGKVIYTDYVFAFEVAGLVLLVAIIAAIALTARKGKDSKRQRVSDQVKVRAQDRVRIVKMQAEKATLPATAEGAAGEPNANVGAGAVNSNR